MKSQKIVLILILTLTALLIILGSYFLHQAFSGNLPIPQYLNLGPLNIRIYSLCILLGVLSSYLFAFWRAKTYKIPASTVDDLLLLGVPLGLIGTRLAYVLLNLPYYMTNPLSILFIWEGGLTLHGGFVVAILILFFYTRVKKISPWVIGDAFAPALLIAEAFGRFGNFFNQELIGYPTTGLIKMFVDPAFRPWGYQSYLYYHPVFLYQFVANFLSLGVILLLEYKRKFRSGEALLSFFFLHSLSRFVVEFWRMEPRVFLGLSLAQIISLLIMLVAALILVLRRLKPAPVLAPVIPVEEADPTIEEETVPVEEETIPVEEETIKPTLEPNTTEDIEATKDPQENPNPPEE